jgi:DNA-binding NarL/FixJ family response regulator
MREGLRTILELEPGFAVVGEAADGAEAVHQAERLRPDIVLMDVQMPGKNGVEATAAITTRELPCRVVILTTFDYEDYVFEAIKAGAVAYLLKDTPAAELTATLRRVHAGESIIQPKVATRMLIEYTTVGPPRAGTPPVVAPERGAGEPWRLSEREADVLRLLAEGASNREIAEQLVLAEGTVKNHVSSILMKLHAANRTQAANLARAHGLI